MRHSPPVASSLLCSCSAFRRARLQHNPTMRFLRVLSFLALASLLTLRAHSQAMTSITATSIDAGSGPVTGTLCLHAVNAQGGSISISKQGGGFFLANRPFCQTLTAGALAGALTVPNPVTDSAPGHAYDIIVYDSTSGIQTDLGPVYGIGGASWSLDDYIPSVTSPTTAAFTFTFGSGSAPSSCTAPALDARINNGVATISVCDSGAFLAATSGSNAPSAPSLGQADGTTTERLGRWANAVIAANHQTFTCDNTDYWSAGPVYAPNGVYIDDDGLTMTANPAAFTGAQMANLVTKFVAQRNTNGDIPLVLAPDCTASNTNVDFYSGADNYYHHVPADGWATISALVWDYWKKTGDTSLYTTNVGYIRAALARIPRNPTTNLMTVNAGDEYICGTLFMEVMRNTGDVANCNVWYEITLQRLLQVANAAGDSTNAAFFTSEYNAIAASLPELIDSTSGLLKAATLQNSANLDVQTSALWAWGALQTPALTSATTAQVATIAGYFDANYSTLVGPNGYILNSPTSWAYMGCIPSSGGPPYTNCMSFATDHSRYQSGSWSHDFEWYADVLYTVDPKKALQMSATFASGLNPMTEWYAVGGTSPGGTAQNMESPQGAYAFAQEHPAVLSGFPMIYGTPTLSGVSGVSFPSPSWGLSDHLMTLTVTPTTNYSGDQTLATITFGKTWVDASGQPTYPNCIAFPRLQSAAAVPIWLDTDLGVLGGSPSQATSSFLVHLAPGGALTSGTTYAWMIQCDGIAEQ